MRITVDNFLGQGPMDYTASLDRSVAPVVRRTINQPSELRCSLVANASGFVIPVDGARVTLLKTNSDFLFTGYLTSAP